MKILDDLDKLKLLPKGHDSYGPTRPSDLAIEKAKLIVLACQSDKVICCAGGDGTLQVKWYGKYGEEFSVFIGRRGRTEVLVTSKQR